MQDKMARRSEPFAWELPTIHPSHLTYSSRNSQGPQNNLRSLRGRKVNEREEKEEDANSFYIGRLRKSVEGKVQTYRDRLKNGP